ncbi:MAG: glycosyltransferase family 2 protein [Aminivibrio sp.]|nr:glycosyltransferase family 2 protein [Aminivibrio sp.]
MDDWLLFLFRGLRAFVDDPLASELWVVVFRFVPFILALELPYYLFVFSGILRYILRKRHEIPLGSTLFPPVSCIITCYSEGKDIQKTIMSLAAQLYPGKIEIIPVLDGASANKPTYDAAYEMEKEVNSLPGRVLKCLPKWKRGGRVSSLNSGFALSTGDVIMAMDGDTSFDNDMVENAVRHFSNPDVMCVSGCLRVRNWRDSPAAALQAVEYLVSILASKTGLSEFNAVNNISGAFGIFRRDVLTLIGGWDAGTAEDLDLTLRVKNYFGRHRNMRIVFDPEVMGHTDAPDTFRGFFRQRLRWDGDLFYLYFLKHFRSFSPRLMGWTNLIVSTVGGLLFQIVTPLLLFLYTVFLLATVPMTVIGVVMGLVYLFYFSVETFFFLVMLFFLSERPREDAMLIPLLPLMPVFTFVTRIWSAFAVLWEMTGRGHLDTSMAPWWVLRKTKF